MRIFVTALILALALGGSAFAGNVALTADGASAVCGPTGAGACFLTYLSTSYPASSTIDGSLATEWVANGAMLDPYVLVSLAANLPIDSVTINGTGNTGNSIGFEVFVGPLGDSETQLLTLDDQITPGQVMETGGTPWSDAITIPTSPQIGEILYLVTSSYGSQPSGGTTTSGWDYGYATEISADYVPEPGTFSLIGGAGLLVLGLFRRRFQS